ncbi:ERMES complex subunit, partial [Massospora cicadina]
VQANPVKIKSEISIQARRGMLAAHQPLIVPMLLRISNLRLRGIISLAVSPHSGITLVFKNDPLQGVEVSSTFDDLDNIKTFLQDQIEDTLRTMFQEDLPRIIHSFSDKIRPKKPPRATDSRLTPSFSSVSLTSTLCSESLQHILSPELSYHLDTISLPDLPTRTELPIKGGITSIGLNAFRPTIIPGLHRRNHSYNHIPCLHKRRSFTPGESDYFSGQHSPPGARRHPRALSNHSPPVFHRVGPISPSYTALAPEQGLRGLLETFSPSASSPTRPFSFSLRRQ